MRREGLLEGSGKKSFEDATERVSSGTRLALPWSINDLAPVLAPVEMSLFFEDMHHAPDGHCSRRIGQSIADLVDGGVPARKEDLHDLAFTAGEMLSGIRHGWAGERVRIGGGVMFLTDGWVGRKRESVKDLTRLRGAPG